MIKITLPFPPSVNCLYAGYGRRHKSKRYEKWTTNARTALWDQCFTAIKDEIPLQVTYTMGRPDKRVRDAANFIKAIDDLLVDEEVIPDDQWIHKGIFQWGDVRGVVVEITPL